MIEPRDRGETAVVLAGPPVNGILRTCNCRGSAYLAQYLHEDALTKKVFRGINCDLEWSKRR